MDGGFGLDVVNDPRVTYHGWPLLRTLISCSQLLPSVSKGQLVLDILLDLRND